MKLLIPPRPQDFAPLLSAPGYAEFFLEASQTLSILFEDGSPETISSDSDSGMSFRCLSNGERGIVALMSSAKSMDAGTAAQLRKTALNDSPVGRVITLEPWSFFRQPVKIAPAEKSLAEKIALLRGLDALIRAEFPHIRQASLRYAESLRDVAILNSDGHCRLQERTSLVLSISVVAEKNGILQTAREVVGALKGWELLENAGLEALARRAARRALAKLEAPKASAGDMPVILASSAGGTFIHEAIGHSLEADHVLEGSSPAYRGKIGRAIAPESISVIDDPTLPFARGSFGFDDEGVAAAPAILVKNGVLQDYLHSRATALESGRSSNGHGRRQSYGYAPIPRMSNLYIAPGPDDPKDIVKSLPSGLLVTRMGGGEVNTATGDFVFEVEEGYRIKDGAVAHLVRDANLLGVGPETLKSIDRVGRDIGWGIGTCGKNGQGVPVSDAQPTLRIPKLLVGGSHD